MKISWSLYILSLKSSIQHPKHLIGFSKMNFINIDVTKSKQSNFCCKNSVFMRFSSISINLLEIFRIISFVFLHEYLSQNSINFNLTCWVCFGILRWADLTLVFRVFHYCRLKVPVATTVYISSSLFYDTWVPLVK